MCILSVLYTLLKVVSYYDLSVLSLSVRGLQKSLDGEWVCGLSFIQFFLGFLDCFFNFAKPLTPPAPRIKELTLYVSGVQKLLENLDQKRQMGQIKPPHTVYNPRECAEEIAPILTNIFTTSLTTGTTPSLWRTATIVAIF